MPSTGTLRIEPCDLAAMPATQQREYAALMQALRSLSSARRSSDSVAARRTRRGTSP
jgi:hypothetical protein